MEEDTIRANCLGCFVSVWFWICLVIFVLYAGVVLGNLTSLMKEIPESLTIPGPDGAPAPLWHYYFALPAVALIAVSMVAVRLDKRWGVWLFLFVMITVIGFQLYAGYSFISSIGVLIWPIILIVLTWPMLFPGQTADLPEAVTLRGWENNRD